MLRCFYLKAFVFKIKHYICITKIKIMREYKIEYWFRWADEKDFCIETIEANSFKEAVIKLKDKYSMISIFKTTMLPL